MIACNLQVLLAKKGLKIAKVSRDTKISRTTLTALCSNTSTPKGIRFETINTLCTYLDVQPGELFEFYPIEIIDVEIENVISKSTHTNSESDIIDIEMSVHYRLATRTTKNISIIAACMSVIESSRFDPYLCWRVDILPPEKNETFLFSLPWFVKDYISSEIICAIGDDETIMSIIKKNKNPEQLDAYTIAWNNNMPINDLKE